MIFAPVQRVIALQVHRPALRGRLDWSLALVPVRYPSEAFVFIREFGFVWPKLPYRGILPLSRALHFKYIYRENMA
jgi:hypothetical protein